LHPIYKNTNFITPSLAMPRFLYVYLFLLLVDVVSAHFNNIALQYGIRSIVPLSVIGFIYSKAVPQKERFFLILFILITLLGDLIFIQNKTNETILLVLEIVREVTIIVLICQETTTKSPKIVNFLGQLVLYLTFCLLIYFVLIPYKTEGYYLLAVNFILMAVLFTLASFRKVNDESFRAVFFGLFAGLFAGIFWLINFQSGFHTFAHLIERGLNDLSLYFIAYGFIINTTPAKANL
jgi:hypothetical protein